MTGVIEDAGGSSSVFLQGSAFRMQVVVVER